MIKCEVIEKFTLEKFSQLKNVKKVVERKNNEFGAKDTFECDKEMADYLLGNNILKKKVVKVIEVEPKKEIKEEVIETITTSVGTFGYGPVEVKETKPKTTKKKKKK